MPTSIRLSPELSQRLDRLAEKTGRAKAFYLRQIIESGISAMEDYYLAEDTLERIRIGHAHGYTPPAVTNDLGLDG
jgi:RHH-type transcriptional regulator, rel operon repressor / antitoxin RelB